VAVSVTDEQVAGLEAMLASETDAQAIVYLLTLHKACENMADSDGWTLGCEMREILAFDAVAIFHVLRRLAPETFADALALWSEETGVDING
jgi:hypothetical protein